jgi:hypothetical protein
MIVTCTLCFILLNMLSSPLLVRSVASTIEPTPVYGPNLLTNPGFEYRLAGWTVSAGHAVYSVDSSTYVDGHHSCKGVENTYESIGWLYQDVTSITSPENSYRISGYIKTNLAEEEEGCAIIGLGYVNSSEVYSPEDGYVTTIGYVWGTQDWTFFQSDTFTLPTMPSDTNALWFYFNFGYETGTAWWDNVSLTLVTYPVQVPQGTNVLVAANPDVTLNFSSVTTSGVANAITTNSYPPPPSGTLMPPVWIITTTSMFSGNVIVGIKYMDPDSTTTMHLWQTDIVLGDVNHDGVVNMKDILLIAKALGSTPGSPQWNPNCDLNHDNRIDLKDALLALKNYGKTSHWVDITMYVDTTNYIIYGATTHFSCFAIT